MDIFKSEARTEIIKPQLEARKLWSKYFMSQEKLYLKKMKFLSNIHDGKTEIKKDFENEMEELQEGMIPMWEAQL